MDSQILDVIKETEKSKIYLTYDNLRHCMVVEKHLHGDLAIYHRLKELEHPYLPKIYAVKSGSDETIVVEEYIQGRSIAEINTSEKQ